jgi:hypothetical protein
MYASGATPTTRKDFPSSTIDWPRIPESAANVCRHNASERTATGVPGARSSSASKYRPSTGRRRSVRQYPAEALIVATEAGSPRPTRVRSPGPHVAPIASNAVASRCHVRKLPNGMLHILSVPLRCEMRSTRSASANGMGRSNTASTTLNKALVMPMPSASVTTAASVKPRLRRSCRSPNRTSCRTIASRSAKFILRSR